MAGEVAKADKPETVKSGTPDQVVDVPPYHTAETFRIAQEREAKVNDGKAK